ncbi:MAG: phosphoribosylanthranilate isomerase, partial [Lysobacterales bacterium]
REILESLPLDLLQFHGAEDSRFCASFGLPYIKAIAMGDTSDPSDAAALFPDAIGLLYDSHQTGKAGGTSRTFDWSLLDNQSDRVWLAGGLKPGNVAAAIRKVRPWAVDVSSGVETAPGLKSNQLMQAFIRAAKSVELCI